jgi:hypothetical protein
MVLPLLPLSFDSNFKVAKVDSSGTGPGIYHVLLEKNIRERTRHVRVLIYKSLNSQSNWS